MKNLQHCNVFLRPHKLALPAFLVPIVAKSNHPAPFIVDKLAKKLHCS